MICATAEDWEAIQNEFQGSKIKGEKDLHEALADLVPTVLGKLANKEKEARRQGEHAPMSTCLLSRSHLHFLSLEAHFNSLPRKISTRVQDMKENEEKVLAFHHDMTPDYPANSKLTP